MNKIAHPRADIDDPAFDENPEWTERDFATARPATEMLPPGVAHALVAPQEVGASAQQAVTLVIDQDVLAKFRATGPGWQSRINAALRAAEV